MTQESTTEAFAVGAFSACLDYEADDAEPGGPCVWCGWLDTDHDEVAPVRELLAATAPVRRAS